VTSTNLIGHRPATLSALDGAVAPEAGGYPVVIWLLLGGNFVVRAAGFAYPFMAYHVAGRGHGAEAAGLVLAAFGAGWVAGQLVCGWSVDRIGGRPTLVVAMLSAAVMLAVMASAHSLAALAVGAGLAGMVYDAPRPVLGAAIGDLLPDPERRAKVDAWRVGWVTNLGAAITGGGGALLADRFGIPVLYLIDAAACAVFAVVAACCLPSGRGTRSAAANTSYRQAFADRRLVVLLVSSVTTLTAFMALFAAMPMLMSARGLSAGAYGITQLANAMSVVALTPLITYWLSKRVAARPRLDILAAAAVWTTACMAAAAFAHTTIHFSLAAAACAPGEIAWFVVVAGIVHRIAPAEQRGRYHGIWGSALAASAVFAPILGAVCLDRGGPMLVAAATFTVGLIGAALCWPLARTLADSTSIATAFTTDEELTK
jgi:MFS family permease